MLSLRDRFTERICGRIHLRPRCDRCPGRARAGRSVNISKAGGRILFFCRCPMKCQHSREGRSGILARASCTRLSPKSSWPASTAACTFSAACVFETATSSIWSAARLLFRAASEIRSSTCASPTAISSIRRSFIVGAGGQAFSVAALSPARPAAEGGSFPRRSLNHRRTFAITMNSPPAPAGCRSWLVFPFFLCGERLSAEIAPAGQKPRPGRAQVPTWSQDI